MGTGQGYRKSGLVGQYSFPEKNHGKAEFNLNIVLDIIFKDVLK